MSGRVYNDYERYGDVPVQPLQQSQTSGYYVFSQQGQPVGVAPVSQGGVSGALGLPSMQYSEPRLNLQGLTLFKEVESPPVSPYAEFGEKTFSELPSLYTMPKPGKISNPYVAAYQTGMSKVSGAGYPVSSHIVAATKSTPIAGAGEFVAGGVGAIESVWEPKVPSVWSVAYEKVGLQQGTYAQDIMKQYPGYAAGSVVGEFLLFGAPTGKTLITGIPRFLSKAEGKLIASMSLKTYPELGLRNMIRTYKDNQLILKEIRGMDAGTIKISGRIVKPKAAEWFTEGEMKGFLDSASGVPKVQVEAQPKGLPFAENLQGQRLQTSQLLKMREPLPIMKAESAEFPALFPKQLTPGQIKRMLLAEDYALDFYTVPLPKQVVQPASPKMGEVSKAYSLQSTKIPEAYSAAEFTKEASMQSIGTMLNIKPSTMVRPYADIGTKNTEFAGIFQLPGVKAATGSKAAQSFMLGMAQGQRSAAAAVPSLRYRMEPPRRLRYGRDDDWMPKLGKKHGGSYEERINPFNENFIRDLRRMKL